MAAATLPELLSARAQAHPGAAAAIEGARRLTYRTLEAEVAAMAGLMRRLGVGPGDRVAVLAPPSIDFLVTFLAAATVGAIWVGLNPRHTRAELEFVLDDADPRLVLGRGQIADRDALADLASLARAAPRSPILLQLDATDSGAEVPSIAEALESPTPASSALVRPDPEWPALLVYTSGSTGRPKGALISHHALLRGAAARTRAWPVLPWRTINNFPINHIAAVGDVACATLSAGGCQVFVPRFEPEEILKLIVRERITLLYQIPTMLQMLVAHPAVAGADWSSLDTIVWSGGRAAPELIAKLAAVAPSLAVDYSMTESVGPISLTPRTRDLEVLGETVGWPDEGRGLRIAHPVTHQPTARGEPGEVQIRDDGLFSGYRMPEPPGDAYTPDGWFRTGDLGVLRADGTLHLVGRLKEVFKSGGYNIYPREIEQAIEVMPEVAAVAVVPRADALFGEVGVAFVEPRVPGLDAARLATHCRERLANYKIPKEFVLVDRLPLLPVGKVDRAALREWASRPSC